MKSVSVKDVDQHKFVRALAAFFKKLVTILFLLSKHYIITVLRQVWQG